MRRAGLSGLTAALLLFAPAAAGGDEPGARPGQLGLSGVDEKRLRGFEEGVLGSDHAAAHAGQRRLLRRASAGNPAGPGHLALAAEPANPALTGRWGAPSAIPVMGIHATMLPTGKVMWWSYPQNPTRPYGNPSFPNTAQAWLWDPATGASRRVDPPLVRDPDDGTLKPANIWCSGQSLLADGRVLVTGGNLRYQGAGSPPSPDFAGLNKVFTFNPFNETWTEQPDMAKGRWYPSQVLLPDGRTVIMAGFDETGNSYASRNKDVEVFTPSADMDGRGTITKLGERDGQDGRPPNGNLYPHLFAMPSGRVMVAGPDLIDSWLLHDPGPGNVFGYTNFEGASRRRVWGAGVLRPGGIGGSTQVTLIGGSDKEGADPAGTPTTETIDESDLVAGWAVGASMNVGRSHLNVVLLPDGSMVAVGGGVGSGPTDGQWEATQEQRQVELYDPVTDMWRLGAAQAESRAYHSTAVLLPDGRVVSAGDDVNGGVDRDTAEIFEPPYLFGGPRPVITSAPDTARYGEPIVVGTPDAVSAASLVAPAATTHAVDMHQRVVRLDVEAVPGGASLSTPTGANVAPPGWYMLFVVNAQGVPSVARWVLLGDDPPQLGRIEIENHIEPAGSAARLSFTGGPFGAFQLGHAQKVSAKVPAGRYPMTEASTAGFTLRSVVCSDGSPASVASRRATPEVSPGETVTCVFTNAASPPGTGTTTGGSPSATSPNPSLDRRGPRLSLKATAAELRRGLIKGAALDPSGVTRVEVALARSAGRQCRWWSRRTRSFTLRRRSCRRPTWIRARRVRTRGGVRWSMKLGGRPPAGRYAVALRAVDGKRNRSSRLGRAAPRIRVRR